MKKINIIFYIATTLFALIMSASGLAKLTGQQALVEATTAMGYPIFLLNILGVAYLIGAVAITQPKFKQLRQWGYAGFSVALIGAASSHILAGQAISSALPALILLAILISIVILNRKLTRD